jgi:hypothetical protein
MLLFVATTGDGNGFVDDARVEPLGDAYVWPKTLPKELLEVYEADSGADEVVFNSEDSFATWANTRFEEWFFAYIPYPEPKAR